jgi:hypothetical protein
MGQRDSNSDRKRSRDSVKRTIARYEATNALVKEWEKVGGDDNYLRQLRARATKLRAELRIKGVVFDDGNGT